LLAELHDQQPEFFTNGAISAPLFRDCFVLARVTITACLAVRINAAAATGFDAGFDSRAFHLLSMTKRQVVLTKV